MQVLYRRRQSIESSYRMSHASRGRTSSRDPRYRFVLFAVSQLLQAVWVWLEARVPRRGQAGTQRKPVYLADVVRGLAASGVEWLEEHLARPSPTVLPFAFGGLGGGGV